MLRSSYTLHKSVTTQLFTNTITNTLSTFIHNMCNVTRLYAGSIITNQYGSYLFWFQLHIHHAFDFDFDCIPTMPSTSISIAYQRCLRFQLVIHYAFNHCSNIQEPEACYGHPQQLPLAVVDSMNWPGIENRETVGCYGHPQQQLLVVLCVNTDAKNLLLFNRTQLLQFLLKELTLLGQGRSLMRMANLRWQIQISYQSEFPTTSVPLNFKTIH